MFPSELVLILTYALCHNFSVDESEIWKKRHSLARILMLINVSEIISLLLSTFSDFLKELTYSLQYKKNKKLCSTLF